MTIHELDSLDCTKKKGLRCEMNCGLLVSSKGNSQDYVRIEFACAEEVDRGRKGRPIPPSTSARKLG